ncbi:hypothetical protein [Streptomyces sp. NPDC058374]|uniref:hypothetical protein n=1 Tax=unclassified Streptomyces TaxID=2593676 RepID=UPI003655BCB1
MGELPAHDLVGAASSALVAGLDSPGPRAVAALTRAEAAHDVGELARWIHRSHSRGPALTVRLAELDHAYNTLEYGGRTAAQTDAEVTAEARRLAAGLRPQLRETPWPQGLQGLAGLRHDGYS